jgi:predicted nucleotidyltransferase
MGTYSALVGLFEPIIDQLNNNGVRYVVVGGVAVVLHGYARLTADLDLAVDLSMSEARKAIEALLSMGFRPTAPVDPIGFADPRVRAQWISEKQMRVFSMRDPENPMRIVDLFAENPVDFEELWVRSELVSLADSTVRVASIPDLIAMKRLAGRQQDLQEIEALEEIAKRRRQRMTEQPASSASPSERARADWEGHRLEQLTLGLAATPAQRLAWLEEMILLAHRTGALPRSQPLDRERKG